MHHPNHPLRGDVMPTRKPVLILDKDEPCPHCRELIHIHIERIVTTPGIAATTELAITIEKTVQLTL